MHNRFSSGIRLSFLLILVFLLGVTCVVADVLVAPDSTWKYHKGTVEASSPIAQWRASDYSDGSWSNGVAPFGYGSGAHEGPSCNTLLGDMQYNYTTFFMRKTFTVADASAVMELVLSADYDDGFMVWINGVQVWNENGQETPTYDSLASGFHEADAGYVEFPLGSPAAYLQSGANVLCVQGFNASSDSSDFKIDVTLSSVRRVADTKFSHDRGFFDAAFDVTITTATSGATVRYTTDGSAPTPSTGTPGSTTEVAVVHISGTTCLRAAAFLDGYEPTDVDTHTYIFVADVTGQTRPAGYPSSFYMLTHDSGNETVPVTYGMDSGLISSYGTTAIENSLKALPTLSVVGAFDDTFGAGGGLHLTVNSNESPVSAELIYPDDPTAGFQIDCGIRGHKTWATPKVTRRLLFKSEFGPTKLRYPFFERAPLNAEYGIDRFDRLILRGGANFCFAAGGQYYHTTYARDPFMKAQQVAMRGLGSQTLFAHIYYNGLYWGVYDICERPDHSFSSEKVGGEKDDWFACNHSIDINGGRLGDQINGDRTRYDYFAQTLVFKDMTVLANYQELQEYVNLEQYVDYMLLNFYSGSGDWPGNNWYGGHLLAPQPEPLLFYCWDAEWSLPAGSGNWPKMQIFTATRNYELNSDLSKIWKGADNNVDFRMLVADRFYKYCFNDAVLTDANVRDRWMTLCDSLEPAIVAESARWGTYQAGVSDPVTTNHWVAERDWVYDRMDGCVNRFVAILRDDTQNWPQMYPDIDPPQFHQHGGSIGAGFTLTVTNPNGATGTLVYKTDGTDPRKWDLTGGEATGATVYGSPIPMSRTTHIKARVRKSDGTWSAAHAATYSYTAHHPLLRITEIHYNPLGGGAFEFIEIRNVSGSTTVGLSEMTFDKGFDYTFATTATLGPGKFAVLVRNEAAFTNRYPSVKGSADVEIFGQYFGALANGGERVLLMDAAGVTVAEVRYNDRAPWPEAADGDGFSLVYTGADDAQDDPAKWRASNLIGGSPGYDEGDPYRVVLSEALTHTDLPLVDAIELHNDGSAGVNIGGWYLSDSTNNYRKFQIPSQTLPAGGYVAFDETDFNTDTNDPSCFALNSHGDEVYLTKWDANSNLLYYAEERFGGAANGIAFGRHVKSDGEADFVAQSVTNTLGAANAYPAVGPVVINELMYHPPAGGDEFIELRNIAETATALYDPAHPTNTWRLDGAVEYVFPTGVTMQASDLVLVVATNDPAGFRTKYGVPAQVPIFGPYAGVLDNAGESLKLWRPDTPDIEGVPWILVDRVKYNDNSPWPESADGDGPALERLAGTLYGNDPMNWSASAASNGTPGAANSGVLVGKTAGWRYHDRGTDLGTPWRAAAYADSAWEDGNAPLGYPDTNPDIDTEVDYGGDPGNKQITTYFRKKFVLADPSKVDSLTLRVRYDDGYVAYLDGQEVARGGMPGGAIAYSTLATTNGGSGGAYAEVDLNGHIGKLVQGENVLAVEVHQISATSSDIFMDLEFVHTVTQQPTVAMPTFSPPDGTEFTGSTNVTISTATSGATVFYTTDGSTPDTGSSNNGTASVQVGLTDTTTLKARAYKDDTHAPSALVSATYTEILPTVATPTISPAGGDFYSSVSVTITTVTAGATVFYTTDGSAPSDANYAAFGEDSVGFSLTDSATVKAKAYKQDYNASGIDTAVFNDKTPSVRFAAGSASGSEAQTAVLVDVELSGTSIQTVRVDYQTTGAGTATAGSDYTATAGTLTFDPGQTNKTIALSVTDDTEDENDETVVVELANAVNAELGTSTHVYTITDNDQLFLAYNDLGWDSTQTSNSITTYTTGGGGLLLDYNTGESTPVTVSIAGGVGPYLGPGFGLDANPGTDAYDVFGGIVNMTGLISYAVADTTLSFSNMDASLRYELVLYGNRGVAAYTYRTSTHVLSGVEPGFFNESSTGAEISTNTLPGDTTVIVTGYNTENGHVARWTRINPGTDGQMLVTISDNDSKYYVNAFMLRAEQAVSSVSTTLVAKAGTWRYRKGTAAASEPPTDWRQVAFDDSGWSNGPAPIGYGPDTYGTVLDMQNNYSCVFLRRAFLLQNPAIVSRLNLHADYDDGFVMWLNGQEIARVGVAGTPGSFVAYDETCSGYVAGSSTVAIRSFREGTLPVLDTNNVVAVQLFNNTLGSSDAVFDLELSATSEPLAAAEDDDQDGIPNLWEVDAYGNAAAYHWYHDPDLDGMSVIAEYIAGTGPTNAEENLSLVLGRESGGLAVVSWSAVEAAGTGYENMLRRYRLERRLDLGPNAVWQPVDGYTNVLGQGQTVVYTNTSPAADECFRLKVWLESSQ